MDRFPDAIRRAQRLGSHRGWCGAGLGGGWGETRKTLPSNVKKWPFSWAAIWDKAPKCPCELQVRWAGGPEAVALSTAAVVVAEREKQRKWCFCYHHPWLSLMMFRLLALFVSQTSGKCH